MKIFIFTITVALVRGPGLVLAQVCGDPGRVAGLPSNAGTTDDSPGTTYIMTEKGGINCHGVVKEWRFYTAGGAANCVNVKFQIWRPQGPTGPYLLVGENEFIALDEVQCSNLELKKCTEKRACQSAGDIIFRVPTLEQIPVYPDDMLGWTQDGNGDMLEYNVGAGNDGQVLHDNCGTAVGGTCQPNNQWSRDYSLRAYIVTGPAPTFGNLPNYVDIYEDTPVNTLIFTAAATHQSNIRAIASIMDDAVPLTFSIDPAMTEFSITGNPIPPNDETWFGEIETEVTFDYDVKKTYTVGVVVEGLQVQTTSTLTVNILKLNLPHIITNLPETISISAQNTMANDQIFDVTVSEADGSPLTVVYYIEQTECNNGGGPPVVVVPSPFRIDSNSGIVSVIRDMEDWTEADQCILTIVTTDLFNVVSDTLTVLIVDIKQAVQIINLPDTTLIPETIAGDSSIYKVLTNSMEPETLNFALTSSTPPTPYNFEIDPSFGVVSVVSEPDFDVNVVPSYDLDVKVTDKFGNTDQQVLTVDIDWVNTAPYYDPDVYSWTMPEECNEIFPGCPILPWDTGLLLYVYDRDAENNLPLPGPADTLTCTILPSFGSDKFDIPTCNPGAAGNMLQQVAQIDVDGEPEYGSITLTVKVEDSFGLSDTAVIDIEVYDINDNAPLFNPLNYASNVDENTPGGVSILTVTATDADSGRNGEFTYGINDINGGADPKGSKYFQVHPNTGVLSTKHPVNYEEFTEVEFEVTATDRGLDPGPLRSFANVLITINDVNDNRPEYDCSVKPVDEPYEPDPACFYNLELRDNTLIDYEVMQLFASDVDLISPGVSFYLLRPEDHFTLELDGWIKVKDNLHSSYRYVLYCMAQDNGDPNLLASPPAVVRIDSFPRKDHLIDIVLGIPEGDFNQTSIQMGFIHELRELLNPWFVKMDSYTIDKDKTTVTIYSLEDTSTYLYSNLDKKKHFVHRNSLLDKLRKNLKGDPHDDLLEPEFDPYNPILVEPTYPIWIIDTLEGRITLLLICILLLLLLILLLVCVCKKCKWCCFKDKPPPTKHDWPETDDKQTMEMDDTSLRQRTPSRRGSTDTIHTLIYDPYKNRPL